MCKATDKTTGEVVAVKCVPRAMASEDHFREEADVHREAGSHPNVVGMKVTGEDKRGGERVITRRAKDNQSWFVS